MKTKKRIEAELQKYEGIETFNYEGPTPLVEHVKSQDIGFRNALKWVLEVRG